MLRIARWPVAALLALLTPWIVLAQERPYEWGWGMHRMWWWGWGFGMMLVMLLFWVLVIALLVAGIRWLSGQKKESGSDSALEILRQRYARGEINQEEFAARKKDLTL